MNSRNNFFKNNKLSGTETDLETVLILCYIRFMMDFLAKRGRFCRHSLSYVEKSNKVAAKKTHKDMKR